MKMKLLILSILSMVSISSWAQELIHNESTITVQAGAVLYVEGTLLNTSTGVIANSGTIELKGDFTNGNPAGWNSPNPNTLKFSGGVNSTVTSNTANFYDVVVQKDAGFTVNLADNMNVTHNLDFNSATSGRLVTGNFDVKLTSAATVTGVDADEYVATTGTGGLSKAVTANSTFLFPVGDLTNYTPLSSNYSGSGYTTASLRTRVNNVVHPNKPTDATDFIARYWDVDQTGIAGYSNTMTGTYVAGDLTGTASLVKGAVYNGSVWSYAGASNGASTVIGTTTAANSDFTGTNFFGKVDIKVFLQGAYVNGTNAMTTTLTSNPTIAALMLNSPYADAPASVGSIPAGVTDWIKLELRDPAVPATVLGKASAFLKSDGSIVGTDGVSLPRIKNGLPTSIVAILHRNHLAIRTPNTGINVVSPVNQDLTTNYSLVYDDPVPPNDAMKTMPDGKFAMWAGNANTTGSGVGNIRYAGLNNDNLGILNALGNNTATILTNVYNNADLNMNGVVRYSGLNNDNLFLLNVLNNNTANIWTNHQ